MLKELKISGFKSIVEANLELGRINLFIGGNGSGKSNILESIGVLSAALGRDLSNAELQLKGVRLSVPTLFKSAFKNRKLRVNFGLEGKFDNDVDYDVHVTASETSDTLRFFTEHIRCDGTAYMGRSNHGILVRGVEGKRKVMSPERGLWDRYSEVIDAPDQLVSELNKFSKYCVFSPQTSFLRGTDVENVPVQPIGLLGGGLPQATSFVLRNLRNLRKKSNKESSAKVKLMREVLGLIWEPGWANLVRVRALDPTIVSKQVRTGGSTLYFRDQFLKRGRDFLSAYDSSEGSLYLLFLAIISLHPDAPTIFALDNVDNSLNPNITRVLLEKLIELTCDKKFRDVNVGPEQVFLTSHNPTALDAFDLFDEDQRIFVVKREEKTGYTNIVRLEPKKNMKRSDGNEISKGKNLSEMWISNMIPGALAKARM